MKKFVVNIIIVVFSIIVGITITTASANIPVDGISWDWNIPMTCGNHLAGLPFAYSQKWKAPFPTIIAMCNNAGSFEMMIVDCVIWSGAVYLVTRKIAKSIRS